MLYWIKKQKCLLSYASYLLIFTFGVQRKKCVWESKSLETVGWDKSKWQNVQSNAIMQKLQIRYFYQDIRLIVHKIRSLSWCYCNIIIILMQSQFAVDTCVMIVIATLLSMICNQREQSSWKNVLSLWFFNLPFENYSQSCVKELH